MKVKIAESWRLHFESRQLKWIAATVNVILNGDRWAKRSCKELIKNQRNLFWSVPFPGELAHALVSTDGISSKNTFPAVAKHTDAGHVPYPGKLGLWAGRSHTNHHFIKAITLGCIFLHRDQSTASLISAILNAVLGWGSSSNLQILSPWKVLKYLKITLKSSFQSFYRLSFAFPLPLLMRFLCTWKKTGKKQQQGKKNCCAEMNLSNVIFVCQWKLTLLFCYLDNKPFRSLTLPGNHQRNKSFCWLWSKLCFVPVCRAVWAQHPNLG